MTAWGLPAAEFELTIEGALGPVLRHALGPDLAAQTRTCTTIVAESAVDLGTLLGLLHSRGLTIESIYLVGPGTATL